MAIVATNNITVSNVNDGTITHYAYANSADGTDGFYVGGGTNLLINSNFSSGLANWTINPGTNKDCKAVVTTDSDGDTCIHITGTGVACGIYSAPAPFNQNQITTGSVFAKGTGRIMLVGLEGRPASNFGTVSTESYSKVGSTTQASSNTNSFVVYFSAVNNVVDVYIKFVKLDQGDKATPWSPAPSEAHPSYIGQYTDFNTTASTDPAKYAPWTIFKGNDGVGIKTTDITYAMSTSGTTAPSTGWTSSVPTLVKGQYLWIKTVWTYTDNSSKTGYSVTYISKDGSNGTDGASGIIVSSVAPASPQNGQLWQDTSTTPQLVKKWTGASWVIWELYAQNLKADTLSAISANLGDVSAGTVKLTDDVAVGDTLKKYGIYQSKLGLLSSGPSLSAPGTFSDSKMGVANLNKGELRFMVTDYTEDLKTVQESGISDPNAAFIQFNSYDDGRDELTISSSGSIFMSGQVSQTEQWQTIAPGVVCKRSFGMISLWYSVTPTVSGDFQMGTIPADMRPQFALMFYAPAFQSTTTNDRKIQVNAGGSVILLNAVATGNYRGNLSFTV